MRTSKPISTISYNSEKFLQYKLTELIHAHTISDYMYIKHKAEEDTKKDHIHLWIKPNKLLDTMTLQDMFVELTDDKPLKCIDFVVSKSDDWILYCQHYEPYLKFKNEKKVYHYIKDDFLYYDEENFEYLYHHALRGSDFAKQYQLLETLQRNEDPVDLILSGAVGINMACNLRAIDSMKRNKYQRQICDEIKADVGFTEI